MNLLELIAKRAEGHRHDEEVPFDATFPEDQEKLWMLLSEAEHFQRAARDLVEAIKSDFAKTLIENESVRYGDRVYKVSPKRITRIIDPKAMAEWLGDDWDLVVPFSPSVGDKLKTTGLRAVCERRGADFETIRDTFLDTQWDDETELKAIPLSRAPKYAQKLEHGESTFGRRKQ